VAAVAPAARLNTVRLVRTSTAAEVPHDAVADAVAVALSDLIGGGTVELAYSPIGSAGVMPDLVSDDPTVAHATGAGPPGWELSIVVRLDARVAAIVRGRERSALAELLAHLPSVAVRVAGRLREIGDWSGQHSTAALHRALRDLVATEVLQDYLAARVGGVAHDDLVADTIDYLIELSGTRVEAHELTHGVVVSDVFRDTPRLAFHYPRDIRDAKRAPLLFDGQRSVLVIDPEGRARTELQRHRLGELASDHVMPTEADGSLAAGSLVAAASRVLGGVGFYVRADRTIWTYVDGQPLLVRRGEHWTAFPLELSASIADMVGADDVAALVARTAFIISAQPRGAILAIVEDPAMLDGVVSLKDRFDLRNEVDHEAMRIETRLHHLIDVSRLDEHVLARLATLDGATVLDREGHLLAYGAVVTSTDSQHEGARTAAARTLSETADVVLKVSVDGDITIFRDGASVTTLLGPPRR
jgi:hypothetical protein